MLVLVCYVLSKVLFITQYLLSNCAFDGHHIVPNHDYTIMPTYIYVINLQLVLNCW